MTRSVPAVIEMSVLETRYKQARSELLNILKLWHVVWPANLFLFRVNTMCEKMRRWSNMKSLDRKPEIIMQMSSKIFILYGKIQKC